MATLPVTPAAAQFRITPDAFLDAAEGKTLSFYDMRTGELVGVEQYLSRSLSVWKQAGGRCVYGQITQRHGRICFLYDDDLDGLPVCWWPFADGDRLMVRLAAFVNAQIQEVRSITTEQISCPNAPVS